MIALSRQAPSGDEVAIKPGMEKLGFVLRVSLLQTPHSAAQVSVVPPGKKLRVSLTPTSVGLQAASFPGLFPWLVFLGWS